MFWDTSKAELGSQQRIPLATETDLSWQRCKSLANLLSEYSSLERASNTKQRAQTNISLMPCQIQSKTVR